MEVRRLVVGADDRTGALETAGSVADAGLRAVMIPWESEPEGLTADVVVVDLASRHVEPDIAAARATSLLSIPSRRSAHKIDSTLRGNWAHELQALATGERRVLLVPAFPAAGRTCVGGTVLEYGVPVSDRHASTDIRAPIRSSRPMDHLLAAGHAAVALLPDLAATSRWLRDERSRIGVCDASTDEDLQGLGEAWAGGDPAVILAGTAAAIGAGAGALADDASAGSAGSSAPRLRLPLLVVAGSAHPIVRAQTDRLTEVGGSVHVIHLNDEPRPLPRPSVVVLRAETATGSVSADDAGLMARTLAAHARAWLATERFETLVIIGGDTAAAVLGDAMMAVGGTFAPGMPWCRMLVEGVARGPLVVTKPGGFGDADALLALLAPADGA